jgi:hypothetical protein
MVLTIYRRNDAWIIFKKIIYIFRYLNYDNINDNETCQSDIFKNRALLLRIELNESYWLIYKTAKKCCQELDINKKRILNQMQAKDNMISIRKFTEHSNIGCLMISDEIHQIYWLDIITRYSPIDFSHIYNTERLRSGYGTNTWGLLSRLNNHRNELLDAALSTIACTLYYSMW